MRFTCARTLPLAIATWVISLLVFSSCSSSRPVIHVTLDGLTDSITTLTVTGTLGSRALDGDRRVLKDVSSSFDVFLQNGDTGALTLEIGAVADTGCQVAVGTSSTITIAADTNSYDAEITLDYDSANQGCQLIVNKRGTGSGTVTGGVPCEFTGDATQLCSASFVIGTQVTLNTETSGGSYFAGWAGVCSGSASCTVTISSLPQRVTAAILPSKLCVGSICWEHPLPQGSSLNAVFGVSSEDLWMIGEQGTLLHWNGVWTESSTAASSVILHAGWGSATNRVWTVGDSGTIQAWNGTEWKVEQSPTGVALYGIWGSADNVWAVGENGTILLRSGGVWTAQSSGVTTTLTSVWGTDISNLWAVGENGTILKWDRASSRNGWEFFPGLLGRR